VRREQGNDNSFLARVIRDLDAIPDLRSGKESIDRETRDLFRACCMSYIRTTFGDFQAGADALRNAGIDYRRGARVHRNDNSTYSLTVHFTGGTAEIPDLEQYFTDDNGIYNGKGYYDSQTVEKFEKTVFQLLNEILGRR
jgi:hypothetical protein